jgi:hypothetical protein
VNINPWRGWFYLVKRDDMPNVPYVDLRDCGLTGQLAQPDDPKMIETLGRGFELGVQPGLWVPDRPNETAAGYVARVADAITAIQQAKLGPNLVVLNPEWNAIGKGDFDRTKPARPGWWTWLDDALTQLRTRYPSRLFDVSIPAMQDYVNWPAVFPDSTCARGSSCTAARAASSASTPSPRSSGSGSTATSTPPTPTPDASASTSALATPTTTSSRSPCRAACRHAASRRGRSPRRRALDDRRGLHPTLLHEVPRSDRPGRNRSPLDPPLPKGST